MLKRYKVVIIERTYEQTIRKNKPKTSKTADIAEVTMERCSKKTTSGR
jgi:hypothetical protein